MLQVSSNLEQWVSVVLVREVFQFVAVIIQQIKTAHPGDANPNCWPDSVSPELLSLFFCVIQTRASETMMDDLKANV